jgi:ABC-type uncharacterized transport system auxiliary subunit
MRQAALVLALWTLSACSLLPSKAPTKTEFDFGPEPNPSDPALLPQMRLVVYDISAPTWMDGTAMHYRLAYQNAAVPRDYAKSEWVMSPAALLTERLRSRAAVHVDGATYPGGAAKRAPCALHSELLEFEQVFDAPDRSHGALRLRATLKCEGVWAQRTFAIDRPAPTANAAGGVTALVECSEELESRIEEWVSYSDSRSPPSASRN